MSTCPTRFSSVAQTTHNLQYADLETIDLDQLKEEGGKERLTKQLNRSLQQRGIFYVSNLGIPAQDVDRQYDIAKAFFDLPSAEKLRYYDIERFHVGNSTGFSPPMVASPRTGVPDNHQIYMMAKVDGHHPQEHPEPVMKSMQECEKFTRDCHDQILFPLLRLIASALELPDEETLVRMFTYDEAGECQYRWMFYGARSPEDNAKLENLYGGAHRDIDMLTFHFRQPIAALQIPELDGSWSWVKPKDDALVCNVGDALEALSGGLFKAALHRVHVPPPDQADRDRLGVFLFTRANDHHSLNPLADSPVLQRAGRASTYHDVIGKDNSMGNWVRDAQRLRIPEDVANGAGVATYG